MFRLKTLSVLVGLIDVLAVSAVPASAWWRANSSAEKEQSGEGKAVVLKSGEFTDEGAKVTCPAAGITVHWSIQTKGEIKIHNKEEKQLKTKEGPHLNFLVNWGAGCTAEASGLKFKAGEVTVSECELQLVQQKGSAVATAGVVTQCQITVDSLCIIHIPAGMEKQQGSNEGRNVGLNEVKLATSGSNQLDEVNVKGILAELASGSSKLCPLKTNETSELKGAEFEVVGVTLV